MSNSPKNLPKSAQPSPRRSCPLYKTVVKFTTKLREFLIFLLPASLFLASYPQISLGSTESMNLEISIPELWLVFFSAASLSNLPKLLSKTPLEALDATQKPSEIVKKSSKLLKFLPKTRRGLFLWTAIFPLYATISLLWTANFLRGLLTVGLLWLLWFSIWSLVLTLKTANPLYRAKLQTVFLATSAIFAGVCWLQCLLDVFGASSETSLLCEGCVSASFGFPHPNGLTLEPQFMGNLLLAPTFYAFNLYLKSAKLKKSKTLPEFSFAPLVVSARPWCYLLLFAFFAATLFLTFSRGAIYAFAVAFVARLVADLIQTRTSQKSKFGSSLLTIPIIILSFVFTLAMQGVFAELGPTSTDFVSATTSSIHQLSLGKIDLRPNSEQSNQQDQAANQLELPDQFGRQTQLDQQSTAPSSDQPAQTPDDSPTQSAQASAPTFSGYVAESTDIRVSLTNQALDVWRESPENALFGTGFGSAGTELYKANPDLGTSKEIVQNEYASILLELGVLGYLCLALTLLPFLRKMSALELSYLLTLFFFSGLPNAFHVYLFPPLLRTPENGLIPQKS